MKGIIKEPGQRPRVTKIENSLSALQEAVGGYIETVTLAKDEQNLLLYQERCYQRRTGDYHCDQRLEGENGRSERYRKTHADVKGKRCV